MMTQMRKPIYFIADLHLSEQYPHITQLFLQFMHSKAPLAEAVYILGDLFDFWIGDDEQSDLIYQVKNAISQLTQQGISCYFICGNRDFLLGKRFAQDCGLTLLPDYHLIELYGKRALICHGDTLCIDDVKYQQFRQKVHQKWRQWLFLCLPLRWRVAIAHKIRAKSKADKSTKSLAIMDVNLAFTEQKMQEYQATLLIHGHTHRQAVHSEVGFTRVVLGDWGETASIFCVTEFGFEFEE